MMHTDHFIARSRIIMRRNILVLLLALSSGSVPAVPADGCSAAGRPAADSRGAPHAVCEESRNGAYPFAELLEDPAGSGPALALAAVLLGGMALRARPR
jgi:hypothetical protein